MEEFFIFYLRVCGLKCRDGRLTYKPFLEKKERKKINKEILHFYLFIFILEIFSYFVFGNLHFWRQQSDAAVELCRSAFQLRMQQNVTRLCAGRHSPVVTTELNVRVLFLPQLDKGAASSRNKLFPVSSDGLRVFFSRSPNGSNGRQRTDHIHTRLSHFTLEYIHLN